MRKNKALLKKVTSFLLASVMLASNVAYADETALQTQAEQEKTTAEIAMLSEQEPQTIISVDNNQESVSLLEETVASQMETQVTVSESISEETVASEEVQTTISESVSESPSEVETSSEQETTAAQMESSTQESESLPEEELSPSASSEESASESTAEEDTSESEEESTRETEEVEIIFGVTNDDTDNSVVVQENGEYVKTYSIEEYLNVDTNPVYLGLAGTSAATSKYYDQLDSVSKKIYDQIYQANKSKASTTRLNLNLTKIFENLTVIKNSKGGASLSDQSSKTVLAWLTSYVTPAYLALLYDHPEMVWLTGSAYSIGYTFYPSPFENGETTMTDDVELASSYFTLKPNSQNGTLTSSVVDPLFNQTKAQIDQMLPSKATDYDKVKAIHDKICSMVSYEDKNLGNAYYQTPYSLYIDADGDGKIETVCAGYAKMMKLQCDKYGIPCVLVTGVTDTGEAHMWNYIKIDGAWYAVDATWDDQSVTMYDFFMVGSETYSSAAFGSKKFSSTHMASGKWSTSVDCVFRYPVLSTNAYKSANQVVQNGLVQSSDGTWYYYKNNQIDASYTGLVTSGNDLIYIQNGVQNTSFTSLLYINNTWYYVVKGKVNKAYTGLVLYEGTWYYIKNGTIDWSYTGLCLYSGTWYYIKKGVLDWGYTGLCLYEGTWYYIQKGIIGWGYTGLCLYEGTWYYIQKGMIGWSYTGLYLYEGTWYYIQKGTIGWSYTGLCLYNETWYYIKKGVIDWNYTGLCLYEGTWYYIQKGTIGRNYTRLCLYEGTWYYIKNGTIGWSYTGLCLYEGTWYYIQKGMIGWSYTGLCLYEGTWYYVQKGMIGWSYTGLCSYNGSLFYVAKGVLDWNYSGKVSYNGRTYTVVKGVAK